MGRLKKYKTEEEKKRANRIKARKYYLKNADKIKKRRMEKYYEEKNSLSNNK
tara:strand:- start:813 stop:968 length:156 start_codon:yes stop_codon:yes gene_type:complete